MWDPSGQPAYGITHMGPMLNQVALPIWVPYGQPIWVPYMHGAGLVPTLLIVNTDMARSGGESNTFFSMVCNKCLPSK